jgi:hypothetical protein
MSLSRRKFLRAGTLVAVSAAFPLKTLVAATAERPSSLIPNRGHLGAGSFLNQERFSRCLNTKFTFYSKDRQAVSVKLVEVYDLTSKSVTPTAKECFGVVFRGPRTAPLRQETYTVEHESLGKFDMLVVPITSRKEGQYYEAIFNRLR